MRRALAILGFSLSCSDSTSSAPPPATGTGGLPCDVEELLDTHCRTCHTSPPKFGAPMSLLSYDSVVTHSSKILARMKGSPAPMPPPPNARLSSDQIAIFENWVNKGTPRTECATNPKKDAAVTPQTCTPDRQLKGAGKWTMPKTSTDAYVCYGVDMTESSKRHITAMLPRIDNAGIVHHIIVLEADRSVPSTPELCTGSMASAWRMIYAWAPGSKPILLPEAAGFPLEGTKHYVVQVHYNNLGALEGQQDESGIDLCTTDKLRPNDADIIAFGTVAFTIPPRSTYARDCAYTLPNVLADKKAFAVFPHMHQARKSIVTSVLRGSDVIDLGKVDSWDFNTQYWLPLDVTLQAGDTIRTKCTWTNPNSDAISSGERTQDEMCYSFTMYYPRAASIPNWSVPARGSRCD